jgi:ubiquinone biosynthesis protein
MVIRAVLRTGAVPETVNLDELRRDIERLHQKYYDVPLNQIEVAESMQDFLALAYRHRVRLPTELTMLIKALVTADGVVRMLDPKISIVEVAKPLGRRLLAERFSVAHLRRVWQEQLPEYGHVAARLPFQVHEVLEQLSRGRLRIRQENPGLDRLSRNITVLTNRVILTLLVITLFFSAGLFARQELVLFGAVAAADATFVAGAVLGAWLVLKILRSGLL